MIPLKPVHILLLSGDAQVHGHFHSFLLQNINKPINKSDF